MTGEHFDFKQKLQEKEEIRIKEKNDLSKEIQQLKSKLIIYSVSDVSSYDETGQSCKKKSWRGREIIYKKSENLCLKKNFKGND